MQNDVIRFVFNNLGIKEVEAPISTNTNSIIGCYNGFFIFNQSYYWVVRGRMPLKYAEELYKFRDSHGIRVEGGANSNKPIEWCTSDKYYRYNLWILDLYSNNLISSQDLSEQLKNKKSELMNNDINDFYVSTYHIDKNEGLKKVIDIIKKYDIKTIWG